MSKMTRRTMVGSVVGLVAMSGCTGSEEEDSGSNTQEGGETQETEEPKEPKETQETKETEESDSSESSYDFENEVRKSISCEVRDYSKNGSEGAQFGQLNVVTCNPNDDQAVGEQMLKIGKVYADYIQNSDGAPILLYCDMFLTGAQEPMGGFHVSEDWAKAYNAGELSDAEYISEIETSVWNR